ncbi:MAG: aminodeoxychorismate synthase component I [Gallionellaceae bacterium]|nr:aminodeoxychorismate synthase component I [Gallionellaceae bacterium]
MPYKISIHYLDDAAPYYAAIADLPWAVWLDSAGMGRYDILCAQPVATFVTRAASTAITDTTGTRYSTDDPFDLLRAQLGKHAVAIPGIPFAGGALGYWGYDLARRIMLLPAQAQDTECLPDMAMGIYDWAIVLDHDEKAAYLVSQQHERVTAQVLPQILERLQGNFSMPRETFKVHGSAQSNLTRTEYESAFNTVQRYLYAGDCYQVNLAQRYVARASGDPFDAYLELRRLSPAPYSAYLNLPQAKILCASPERFLRVLEGKVETKPIKGTRPRMADAQLDVQAAHELQSSGKDRTENLMIVDLLRNDLGKSCVPGSVQVPNLFGVESFAHVHHLVSTVTGELADGQDALMLLRNCFPGGSVTGAPKQRAMEIIEQIEPQRRGVYCGAIGYVSFDGNMDSNIAIRTLVYSDGEIRFWAGGGIVADSDAAAEYQETLDKAVGMLKLLRHFGKNTSPF